MLSEVEIPHFSHKIDYGETHSTPLRVTIKF